MIFWICKGQRTGIRVRCDLGMNTSMAVAAIVGGGATVAERFCNVSPQAGLSRLLGISWCGFCPGDCRAAFGGCTQQQPGPGTVAAVRQRDTRGGVNCHALHITACNKAFCMSRWRLQELDECRAASSMSTAAFTSVSGAVSAGPASSGLHHSRGML